MAFAVGSDHKMRFHLNVSDVPIAVFLVLFSNFGKEGNLAKDCL